MKNYKNGDVVVLLNKKISGHNNNYDAPVNTPLIITEEESREGFRMPAGAVFISWNNDQDFDMILSKDLISEEEFNSPLYKALR